MRVFVCVSVSVLRVLPFRALVLTLVSRWRLLFVPFTCAGAEGDDECCSCCCCCAKVLRWRDAATPSLSLLLLPCCPVFALHPWFVRCRFLFGLALFFFSAAACGGAVFARVVSLSERLGCVLGFMRVTVHLQAALRSRLLIGHLIVAHHVTSQCLVLTLCLPGCR